ncbi:hypothetical protein B0H17DRAFT_17356 [Mycena rosella]|uniref:Uncharacterized protein n=1 Tax=Mycena rosella TaxID=1033263 RepID=A0AAD7F967_MYCRO|nr:hypothetical protein B0H17DRAFT_17356 [Mycena rosella]
MPCCWRTPLSSTISSANRPPPSVTDPRRTSFWSVVEQLRLNAPLSDADLARLKESPRAAANYRARAPLRAGALEGNIVGEGQAEKSDGHDGRISRQDRRGASKIESGAMTDAPARDIYFTPALSKSLNYLYEYRHINMYPKMQTDPQLATGRRMHQSRPDLLESRRTHRRHRRLCTRPTRDVGGRGSGGPTLSSRSEEIEETPSSTRDQPLLRPPQELLHRPGRRDVDGLASVVIWSLSPASAFVLTRHK